MCSRRYKVTKGNLYTSTYACDTLLHLWIIMDGHLK